MNEDDDIILLTPGDSHGPSQIETVHNPSLRLGLISENDVWLLAKQAVTQAEFTSMREHRVWDVVDVSPGMKPITCKGVFSD